MIFIVDDDREFAECIARQVRAFCDEKVEIFSNGIEAISAIDEEVLKLILLDILLDGPDGFTFLNELMSYSDTEKIPVVVMSSLKLNAKKLKNYGVVGVLDKAEMTPMDLREIVEKYIGEDV